MSERMAAASAVAAHLSQSAFFQSSQSVACYFATSDELGTRCLLEMILAAGKACYLPVLNEQTNSMTFARYQQDVPLRLNRYGINEPMTDDVIASDKLDMVLLPLLGFDKAGHRLGMGGGYYDKTFSFLVGKARPAVPLLLGAAFAIQGCDDIPIDDWDVMIDGVVTECGVRLFR